MHEVLRTTPSKFSLPEAKGENTPGAKISRWEHGADNIPFAYQHRYGTIAGCYSGVLHLVSLFYSNWRDAKLELDERKRQEFLSENTCVARGLISLANLVLEENKLVSHPQTPQSSGRQPSEDELQKILRLIDAYCVGAGTKRITHPNTDSNRTE